VIAPSEVANLDIRKYRLKLAVLLSAFLDRREPTFQDNELGKHAVGTLGVVYRCSLFDSLIGKIDPLQLGKITRIRIF